MHGKLLHLDLHIQFIHMTSHVYEQVFTGFHTGEWETGIPLQRIERSIVGQILIFSRGTMAQSCASLMHKEFPPQATVHTHMCIHTYIHTYVCLISICMSEFL